MAKGTATEVGNGRLCGLSRGVWGHSPLEFFWKFNSSEIDSGAI